MYISLRLFYTATRKEIYIRWGYIEVASSERHCKAQVQSDMVTFHIINECPTRMFSCGYSEKVIHTIKIHIHKLFLDYDTMQ